MTFEIYYEVLPFERPYRSLLYKYIVIIIIISNNEKKEKKHEKAVDEDGKFVTFYQLSSIQDSFSIQNLSTTSHIAI